MNNLNKKWDIFSEHFLKEAKVFQKRKTKE